MIASIIVEHNCWYSRHQLCKSCHRQIGVMHLASDHYQLLLNALIIVYYISIDLSYFSFFSSSSCICFDSSSILSTVLLITELEEALIFFSFISRGKSFWRGLIITVAFLFCSATFISAFLIFPSLPAVSFFIFPNCHLFLFWFYKTTVTMSFPFILLSLVLFATCIDLSSSK